MNNSAHNDSLGNDSNKTGPPRADGDRAGGSSVKMTPEEQRIYENKLKMEIEKHKEKLLMLRFDVVVMQKQLLDLFVENNDNRKSE